MISEHPRPTYAIEPRAGKSVKPGASKTALLKSLAYFHNLEDRQRYYRKIRTRVNSEAFMKRLATLVLLASLSVSCSIPVYAQARTSAKAQSRATSKAEKKQQKAMKKYAKAQRKAERKMLKTERKNTHYPSNHF